MRWRRETLPTPTGRWRCGGGVPFGGGRIGSFFRISWVGRCANPSPTHSHTYSKIGGVKSAYCLFWLLKCIHSNSIQQQNID